MSLALVLIAGGCAPVGSTAGAPTASASPTETASPTPSPVFVPNAESYFVRIDHFDFPTAPSAFIEVLTRSYGGGANRQMFPSYAGRSVIHDGVQLPAVIAVLVVNADMYGKADTFDRLSDEEIQSIPGSTGRPLTIGALHLPGTELTLPNKGGYVVMYQQGFFYVQVIGGDPVLLGQIAEVLVTANARRQP